MQQDALAALRDIHLPDAVSFWPPAPAWWLLFGGLVVAPLLFLLLARWRRRDVRRAALREIERIEREFGSSGDSAALAASLSSLLRRVALARFPRSEVASLHGGDRLSFLSTSAPNLGFPAEVLTAMERSLYSARSAKLRTDGAVWIAATRDWVRRIS